MIPICTNVQVFRNLLGSLIKIHFNRSPNSRSALCFFLFLVVVGALFKNLSNNTRLALRQPVRSCIQKSYGRKQSYSTISFKRTSKQLSFSRKENVHKKNLKMPEHQSVIRLPQLIQVTLLHISGFQPVIISQIFINILIVHFFGIILRKITLYPLSQENMFYFCFIMFYLYQNLGHVYCLTIFLSLLNSFRINCVSLTVILKFEFRYHG